MRINDHFKANDNIISSLDPQLYGNIKVMDDIVIVILFVDDLIISRNNTRMME
jgi:hypothetical protein